MIRLLPLVLLSGCATILTPNSQRVIVDSDPARAFCVAEKGGQRLWYGTTPAEVYVPRLPAGASLRVGCALNETAPISVAEFPPTEDWATSVMLGGIGGWGIDELSGAAYRYPSRVEVHVQE